MPQTTEEAPLPMELERSQSSSSTIADPNLEQDAAHVPSSSARIAEPDPRNSLQHVLADEPSSATRGRPREVLMAPATTPSHPRAASALDGNRDTTEDEADAGVATGHSKTSAADVSQTAPGGGGRRNAHGTTTSSIYGGNKMKNIKKEDGIPLWRIDIQYEFLRAVFDDKTAVFTNTKVGYKAPPEKKGGCTFADIYIDAMAYSPKTSKILREKLLSDRSSALNMAMVCLLVNVVFPEMRAQLRTYHAIPCLQAKQDPNAYKQLQDAPRLKSILKGACEDKSEPNTIEALKSMPVPRTNPVNLIFVLSQYAPKLTDLHFSLQLDFFDLITRTTLSSRSRARGFLWLMWWYLESDFTAEDAIANPFGQGQPPEVDGIPQKLPSFEHLTEEQKELENVDTPDEREYGTRKQEERRRIMESDAASAPPPPKRGKKAMHSLAPSDDGASPARDGISSHPARAIRTSNRAKPRKYNSLDAYHSDTDRTRSASPPGLHPTFNIHDSRTASGSRAHRDSHTSNAAPPAPRTGRGRWPRDKHKHSGPQRIILKTRMDQVPDGSSPAPPGSGHPVLHPDGNSQRRPRPLTAHQIAVERNRQQRVDYLLDRRLRKIFSHCEKSRLRDGAFWRAWTRHEMMADPLLNSDDETRDRNGPFREHGPGGLIPLDSEADDYGEEIGAYAAAVRRSGRRLERWHGLGKGKGGVMGPTKAVNGAKKKSAAHAEECEEGESRLRESSLGLEEGEGEEGEREDGENEGELDDMDRELLGEMDGDEEAEDGDGDEMDVD